MLCTHVESGSLPIVVSPFTTPPVPTVQSAADLATAYNQNVAACWRGETDGHRFGDWLEGCWQPTMAVPPGAPAAISVHGASGRGIAWYDAGPAVVGLVRGCPGGYWIRRGAPLVRDSC